MLRRTFYCFLVLSELIDKSKINVLLTAMLNGYMLLFMEFVFVFIEQLFRFGLKFSSCVSSVELGMCI